MNPTEHKRILQRGYASLDAGNLQDAAGAAKSALKQDGRSVPAHFLVGLTALAAGERKVAFQAFSSVIHLDAAHSAALGYLARLLLGEGDVDQASALIQRAIRSQPDEPMVLDLIGTVLSLLGEHDNATAWFRKAVAARPEHLPFLQNLANNRVVLGDTGAAEAMYEHIVLSNPDHAQAHWALSGVRTARSRSHIDMMQQLLEEKELDARSQAFLFYACGKEFEDLGLWEDAFTAVSSGAAARRQTVAFDEENEIAAFAALSKYLTSEYVTGASGCTDHQRTPIFIVGEPRTGTTLIERILAAHSQVHAAGELQHFHLALRKLSGVHDPRRFTPELFERASRLDPLEIGKRYINSTQRLQGNRTHFIDKLPLNYLSLPLILAALPRARIIHLMRDPMDACFASFKQLFADAYLHSYSQGEMARHHLRYMDLMATWRSRFPGRFLDIGYEETVRDLPGTAQRLLDWVGLPWEDACIRFHEQEGAVATASAVQVREPVHARSVGRWRRYETQLTPMRAVFEAAGIVVE